MKSKIALEHSPRDGYVWCFFFSCRTFDQFLKIFQIHNAIAALTQTENAGKNNNNCAYMKNGMVQKPRANSLFSANEKLRQYPIESVNGFLQYTHINTSLH